MPTGGGARQDLRRDELARSTATAAICRARSSASTSPARTSRRPAWSGRTATPTSRCWPVPGTLVRRPGRCQPAGQFLSTLYELDGTPCRRSAPCAERIVDALRRASALTPVAAIELEFYLVDRDARAHGRPQPPASPVSGAAEPAAGLSACSDLDDFRRPSSADLYAAGEAQGLPAQTLISEYAPGQFEIGLHHRDDALRAVDEAIMYKRLVEASPPSTASSPPSWPSPYPAIAGSGMHVHVSLQDAAGRNAFASDDPKGNELLRHAIGGMAATMADCIGDLRAQRQLLSPLPPQLLCAGRAELGHQQPLGQPARAGRPAGDAPCRAPRRRRRRQSVSGARRPCSPARITASSASSIPARHRGQRLRAGAGQPAQQLVRCR